MASEHRTERLSTSHMNDMIDHLMLTFEAAPSHVMIGLGVVDLDRVITKTTRGMLILVGVHCSNFELT